MKMVTEIVKFDGEDPGNIEFHSAVVAFHSSYASIPYASVILFVHSFIESQSLS